MSVPEPEYDLYLQALLAGNRAACAAVVRELRGRTALRDLYVGLFQRSLYEVGELWESNRISVATEHLATAITEQMLTLLSAALFAHPRHGRRAVIACVADEFHQLGARIVADYLETLGWDTRFLGANTPSGELIRLLREWPCELVGLSLSVWFNMPRLQAALAELTAAFPQQRILLGGQAWRHGGGDWLARYPQVALVGSLADLERLAA